MGDSERQAGAGGHQRLYIVDILPVGDASRSGGGVDSAGSNVIGGDYIIEQILVAQVIAAVVKYPIAQARGFYRAVSLLAASQPAEC